MDDSISACAQLSASRQLHHTHVLNLSSGTEAVSGDAVGAFCACGGVRILGAFNMSLGGESWPQRVDGLWSHFWVIVGGSACVCVFVCRLHYSDIWSLDFCWNIVRALVFTLHLHQQTQVIHTVSSRLCMSICVYRIGRIIKIIQCQPLSLVPRIWICFSMRLLFGLLKTLSVLGDNLHLLSSWQQFSISILQKKTAHFQCSSADSCVCCQPVMPQQRIFKISLIHSSKTCSSFVNMSQRHRNETQCKHSILLYESNS